MLKHSENVVHCSCGRITAPKIEPIELGAVTIRPLWFNLRKVELSKAPWGEFQELSMTATVLNRDTGQPLLISRGTEIHLLDKRHLGELVRQQLRELMLHELDEVLLVDGKLLRDPHAEER